MPVSIVLGEAGFLVNNGGFLKDRKKLQPAIDNFANDAVATATMLKNNFGSQKKTFYVSNNPLDKLTMSPSNSNCVSCLLFDSFSQVFC